MMNAKCTIESYVESNNFIMTRYIIIWNLLVVIYWSKVTKVWIFFLFFFSSTHTLLPAKFSTFNITADQYHVCDVGGQFNLAISSDKKYIATITSEKIILWSIDSRDILWQVNDLKYAI